MQTMLTQPGPLLTERGTLAQRGYATSLLLDYRRSSVAASRLRIKEWDYYLINDGSYALAFTIGDLGYVGMFSASIVDLGRATFKTTSVLSVLPLGKVGLPSSSDAGVSEYRDKRVNMRFSVADGLRHIEVEFRDFDDGKTLTAEIVLDEPPRDSMAIATPWAEDDRAFYYNQKIVGMRAIGSFTCGDVTHSFQPDASFGLLDWGRGVWTRDNMWYWSAAQGMQAGHRFGMNLGYGFGDTSAASENMLFVDGVAHKLGAVDFGIPRAVADGQPEQKYVGDRFRLMEPWRMTDDAGRLELTFTPILDRCDFMDFKVILTDQHQVFGRFDGEVVLDDGARFPIANLVGFAEAVHNRY